MIFTILTYIIFLSFSLGQLGRISFLDQQINFYFYEIFLVFLLLMLFIKYRLKPIFSYYSVFRYFYWLIGFLFFSYFIYWSKFSGWQNLIGLLYQLRFFSYFLFFIYLGYHQKEKKDFNNDLKRALRFFILTTVVSTILQYCFYPDLRNLIYQGWDPHYFRAFGVFFDTAFAAGIFGMIFFYLYFAKDIILSAVYFLFIFFTLSRSIIISFIVSFIFILWQTKKIRRIVFLILTSFLILFLIPKPFGEGVNIVRSFSIKSRLADYQSAYWWWKKSPVFGFGYNRLRYIKEPSALISHAGASFHSSFLVMLVCGGIVGLILYGLCLISLAKINRFSQYLVIFLGLSSLSDNILLHPFVLYLFFSVVLSFLFVDNGDNF